MPHGQYVAPSTLCLNFFVGQGPSGRVRNRAITYEKMFATDKNAYWDNYGQQICYANISEKPTY